MDPAGVFDSLGGADFLPPFLCFFPAFDTESEGVTDVTEEAAGAADESDVFSVAEDMTVRVCVVLDQI